MQYSEWKNTYASFVLISTADSRSTTTYGITLFILSRLCLFFDYIVRIITTNVECDGITVPSSTKKMTL